MVLSRITTTSTTIIEGGPRVSKKDATSFSVALKGSQQLYRASRIDSKYKGILTSIAKQLNAAIETAIVKELGGGQIKAGRGGFYPDFFLQLEDGISFREQKLVSTIEEEDRVVRKGAIKLAGGQGIVLQRGTQELLTGFDTSSGAPEPIKEELPTTRFINSLIKNKNNQEALITILSGRGKAASAVRTTMVTKANTIDIPVQFRGRLENRSISFSYADIVNAVKTKKGKITVVEFNDGVQLNFSFNGSTITQALNNMNKVIIKELNGRLGKEILQALSDQITVAGPGVAEEIRKFLQDLNLEHALKYIPGSAKIVTGTVLAPKIAKEKRKTAQKFVSGVQLTALVQRRLGQTMERTGDPSPPDLKERSGRFRKSITVIPNYRSETIRFMYNPLYSSLKDYGYNPDQQIVDSIRDVAASLFKREFRIVRDFNYANK